MADTNNYKQFQKVEKWTTKENFNKLGNLTEIETGTEYNLAGPIEENDLIPDLQTKINGKLTKPTNPSAESAVTMLADGTIGTKPLSEFTGKLYRHYVGLVVDKWSSSGESVDYIIGFTFTDTSATSHNRNYWKNLFDSLAYFGYFIPPEPFIIEHGPYESAVDLSAIFSDTSFSNVPYIYSAGDGFTTKTDYGSTGYLFGNRTDTQETYAEYVVEL